MDSDSEAHDRGNDSVQQELVSLTASMRLCEHLFFNDCFFNKHPILLLLI